MYLSVNRYMFKFKLALCLYRILDAEHNFHLLYERLVLKNQKQYGTNAHDFDNFIS